MDALSKGLPRRFPADILDEQIASWVKEGVSAPTQDLEHGVV